MRHVVRICRNDGTEHPWTHAGPCEVDFAEDWIFWCSKHRGAAEAGGCGLCAYDYNGSRCLNAVDLAKAIQADWSGALTHLPLEPVRAWCHDCLGEETLARTLKAIVGDGSLDGAHGQLRIPAALLALDASWVLSWKKEALTLEWLRRNPAQARAILESSLGQWLVELRAQDWLANLHRRWTQLRKQARKIEPLLDRAAFVSWFLAPEMETRAEAARIRAEFCSSENRALDHLIQAATLEDHEAVMLSACDRARLRSRLEVCTEKTAALRQELGERPAEVQLREPQGAGSGKFSDPEIHSNVMATHGATARAPLSQNGFTLLSLLAVSGAFGLSWAGMTLPCLIAGVAGMGALAWFCHARCSATRDGDNLRAYAEQIFILGCLLTLAGIAGVVLQAGNADATSQVRAGGVKLVTAIAGLLILSWGRERARLWKRERQQVVEQDDGVLNSQWRQAIRELNRDAEELRTKAVTGALDPSALSTMAAVGNDLTRLVGDAVGAFSGLKTATNQLSAQLSSVEIHSRQLLTQVQALGGAPVDTRKNTSTPATGALGALAASAGGTASSLPAADAPLAQVVTALEGTARRIEEQNGRFSELNGRLATLNVQLEELEANRLDANVPLERIVAALESTARGMEEESSRLSGRLAAFNTQLEKLAARPEDPGLIGRWFGGGKP